jgi:hypothetical protein
MLSWEMTLNIGLHTSFSNMSMWEWKGLRGKAGKVHHTKAYVTNDETSC